MDLEYHETAINFDHEENLVYVYTTREDVYKNFLMRGVEPIRHSPLRPGYELVYPASICKDPSSLLLI
jgi:hypothetical protein